ncbi:MAG: hypothetical protein F4X56_00945 [Gammaproteobacteria bacterium]|nr:hypothetical protein [Gammaproteobacteria bacterium]MYC24467.1 hypothetical protein [Gammaproteobacteria bacterium]
MRVPILFVLTVALIASGCASVHNPVVQGPDTAPIDTTVSETAIETAGSSEAETSYRPETLEWAATPSPSFVPGPFQQPFRLGVIVGLCAVGLSFLWTLFFD